MRASRAIQLLRCTLACGALAAALPAHAARPLATDDAGTLGAGRRQLELGAALSRDRASAQGVPVREHARELAAALGVGLTEDLDLVLQAAAASYRVREGGALAEDAGGIGDVGVELKWRVAGGDRRALAAKAGVTLPTGDAARGLGTGRPGFSLTLAATRTSGALSLDVNSRYERREWARPEDRAALRSDLLSASLAARAAVRARLQLVAELGVGTSEERAVRAPGAFALAGAVASVGGGVDVDVGARVGLTDPQVDLAWLGGATWRF